MYLKPDSGKLNMKLNIFASISLLIIFASCNHKQIPPSLWPFGKNKKEFKKVLQHYSSPEDSLKLKAAKYLIENMKGHYGYVPKNEYGFEEFFQSMDEKVSPLFLKKDNLYKVLKREIINIEISKGLADGTLKKPEYTKQYDASTITEEYLIENIDYAFKAWELPWSRAYSFDEFCKYILPYRYGNETLEPWRKTFFEKYSLVLDSIKNLHGSIPVLRHICKSTNLEINKYTNDINDPITPITILSGPISQKLELSDNLGKNGIKLSLFNQMDAMLFASCHDQSGLGVCILRSIGIPASIVSCLKHGDRSTGHSMVAFLDGNKEWRRINFGSSGNYDHRTFTNPKNFFENFHNMGNFELELEDGSGVLMDVVDIEVDLMKNAKKNDEITLCVFGDREWYPLWEGENKGTKVLFKNIGQISNMFLAAIKTKKKIKPVSKAFSIDNQGNISYFKPDFSNQTGCSLARKYPLFGKHTERLNALIGGHFSVSETKDFSNEEILYQVDTLLNYDNNLIKCKEKEGKFLRYDFPMSSWSKFDGPAEIAFYTTQSDTLKKLEGKYYASPQLSQEHINLMTDDNMLTYVEVWDCDDSVDIETGRFVLRKDKQPIWIAMELDTPTVVTHVSICPRNDKNGIYPGMRYELFYWDDEWKSLGMKTAKSDTVQFNGIPANAVLWLRNLDEGKEERIFTLKNGKQIWW